MDNGRAQRITGCEVEVVRMIYREAMSGLTMCELRQLSALVRVAGLPPVFKAVLDSPQDVVAGERLVVEGDWGAGKYGMQLKVTGVAPVRPLSLEGMRAYLGSGVIFGIGPVLATRIVETFGVETMRILECEPERLLEVSGIGRQTIDHFLESVNVRAGQASSLGALLQLGLTVGLAQRVLQHFGPQAADVVSRTPYRLTEVWGIGFVCADDIAKGLGVHAEDPARVQAGLRYLLETEAEKGHSCVPAQSLVASAGELLGVPPVVVGHGVACAIEQRVCVAFGPYVYLSKHYEAEREIERVVQRLVRQPVSEGEACTEDEDQVLTAAQREGVRRGLSYGLSVIDGLPGTGKTTCLATLVRAAQRRGQRVSLAAPSWQAAHRVSQVTGLLATSVHQLLEWHLHDGPRRNASHPLEADLVVIDEAPMTDLVVMAQLLCAIRTTRTRVVFVGDVNQLPSVGCGQVIKDLIRSCLCPVTKLLEIQRQAAGSTIIRLSHDVHYGRVKGLHSGVTGDCELLFEAASAQATRRRLLERLPDLYRDYGDVQVLSPMHKGLLGTIELNRAIQQQRHPAGTEYVGGFAVGDRVRVVIQDESLGVTKGEMGEIVACVSSAGSVTARIADRVVSFDASELDRLALAYCVTVHRTQGSQFKVVVLVLDMAHYIMLQREVLYTAMTRASERFVYVGNPKAFYIAAKNHASSERYSGLFGSSSWPEPLVSPASPVCYS